MAKIPLPSITREQQMYPLPPRTEQMRTAATRAAMRWMIYCADVPLEERTPQAAAARFGFRGTQFQEACREDGIIDLQLVQAGYVPIREEVKMAINANGGELPRDGEPGRKLSVAIAAGCRGMGSPEQAEAERLAREGQILTLQARRDEAMKTLEIVRVTDVESGMAVAKLAALVKALNTMLESATGLGVVQGVAEAAAKKALAPLAATQQEAPHAPSNGRIIDLGNG